MNDLNKYPPDTEHPALSHIAKSIRHYMNDHHRDVIYYPIFQRPTSLIEEPYPYLTTDTTVKTGCLNVHVAYAPAPCVGRLFCYTWPVAIDEFGRFVAGSTEVVYYDPKH